MKSYIVLLIILLSIFNHGFSINETKKYSNNGVKCCLYKPIVTSCGVHWICTTDNNCPDIVACQYYSSYMTDQCGNCFC